MSMMRQACENSSESPFAALKGESISFIANALGDSHPKCRSVLRRLAGKTARANRDSAYHGRAKAPCTAIILFEGPPARAATADYRRRHRRCNGGFYSAYGANRRA